MIRFAKFSALAALLAFAARAEKPYTAPAKACKARWLHVEQPAANGDARLVVTGVCGKKQSTAVFTLHADGKITDVSGVPAPGPTATSVKIALAREAVLDGDLDKIAGDLAAAGALE